MIPNSNGASESWNDSSNSLPRTVAGLLSIAGTIDVCKAIGAIKLKVGTRLNLFHPVRHGRRNEDDRPYNKIRTSK